MAHAVNGLLFGYYWSRGLLFGQEHLSGSATPLERQADLYANADFLPRITLLPQLRWTDKAEAETKTAGKVLAAR